MKIPLSPAHVSSTFSFMLSITIVFLLLITQTYVHGLEVISNKIIPSSQYGSPSCSPTTFVILFKDTYSFLNVSSTSGSILSRQATRLNVDYYKLETLLSIPASSSEQSISLLVFNSNQESITVNSTCTCKAPPTNPEVINQPMTNLYLDSRQQYQYIYKYGSNVDPIQYPNTICNPDTNSFGNGTRCRVEPLSPILPPTMLVTVLIPPKELDTMSITNSWQIGVSQVTQDIPPLIDSSSAPPSTSLLSSSSQFDVEDQLGLIILDVSNPSDSLKILYGLEQVGSSLMVTTTIPVLGNSQEMKYFSYTTYSSIYSLYFVDSAINFIKNFTFSFNSDSISFGQPNLVNVTKEFEHYICSFVTEGLDEFLPYSFSVSESVFYDIPYPFGYSKYSNQTGNIVYSIDVPSYGLSSNIQITVGDDTPYDFTVDSSIPAQTPLNFLNKIDIFPATAYTIIVTMNITCKNGLWNIKFNDELFYAIDTLQYSDLYNGIYTFEVNILNNPSATPVPKIQIMDLSYQSTQFQTCYNLNCDSIPSIPYADLFDLDLLNDIKSIEWTNNNIDTSNGPVSVSLLISTTKDNQQFKPILIDQMKSDYYLLNDNIEQSQFEGYYDINIGKYRIDVVVPQHYYNGTYQYSIQFISNAISSHILASLYPNATLLMNSNYADLMAPYVTKLSAIKKVVTVGANDQNVVIGWNVTIASDLGQFRNGTALIISNIDNTPYRVVLGQSTLIETNSDNSQVHRLVFSIYNASKCRSQKFEILDLILDDTSNWRSSNEYPFKPFTFIQSDTINNDFIIELTCINTINDNTLPILKNFTMYPQMGTNINIGSVNDTDRTIYFNITLEDGQSGISSRHPPIIYMISDQGYYQVERPFSTETVSDSTSFYRYVAEIPFRFGSNGILLSIYGITDNYNNMNGYSTSRLQSMSLPCAINSSISPSSLSHPVILSSESITTQGGKLIVRGSGFGGNTSTISVNYGNGYQVLSNNPTIYPIMFIVDIPSQNIPSFTIKINVGGIDSNELTVLVQGYQTDICLGNCSGHGNCTSTGCQCEQGWFGAGCTSLVIENDIEYGNQSPTIISTGNVGGTDSRAQVGVAGVREINEHFETINEYSCDGNWTINVISSEKLIYTCQLYPTLTTLIVTIEIFMDSDTREFAGQLISIPQNSIKYTMNLDSYTFESPNNQLVLLLNMSIESDHTSSVCSSSLKGISQGNLLEWTNLYINSAILYSKFINSALIDYSPSPITTTLLEITKESPTLVTSLVGIQVPNYQTEAIIDPIFQHLEETESKYYQGYFCTLDDQGLSKGQVVGIIVGIVVFCLIVLLSALYFETYRFKHMPKCIKISGLNDEDL